ncbi:MAG TPA: flagellar basal-body rod protein FlgG [Phycisphaerales bacterium]|nr:flagellar basal-body rod protein FlgG [Phycisphaerales bacterium]
MAITALYSASTGLSALGTELDVIANNLANVNTAGFKSSRVNFQDLLYQEKSIPGVENANGDKRPTGTYIGLGVKISGTQVSFAQGSPLPSDSPLDLMIDGKGFFQVTIEDGRIGYTRAGNFTLNQDGEIVLASDQGRRLEPNISIPAEATSIDVNADGEVFYNLVDQVEPVSAGRIELAGFANPTGLKQIGENLFVETDASGPPLVSEPTQNGLGRLQSHFLEGSNTDPTRELIKLIQTQRAFEMNSNVIRAADDTLRAVAQLNR